MMDYYAGTAINLDWESTPMLFWRNTWNIFAQQSPTSDGARAFCQKSSRKSHQGGDHSSDDITVKVGGLYVHHVFTMKRDMVSSIYSELTKAANVQWAT